MAEDYGCKPSEVYQTVGALELAKLVRRRKLSPWLLITSQLFLKWVSAQPQQDRDMLNDAINFGAYAAKLSKNSALGAEFRKACESEGV
jgi:hypothetical protein